MRLTKRKLAGATYPVRVEFLHLSLMSDNILSEKKFEIAILK